jgi:precorrin-3B synthase
MIAALRRGACPSLAAPMRTGDGWLARLTFTEGLTGAQLAGLASVAARLGNGLIEVTARGSLQLRGLAEGAPLAAAIAPLGLPVSEGLPVVTSPLAGLDPAEAADPRPLAEALRGFGAPLPPKATAVVDGGGAFGLDAVSADLRLVKVAAGWQVGLGGTAAAARWLGVFDGDDVVGCALDLLRRMSRENCRGGALEVSGSGVSAPQARSGRPVGRFALRAGVARGVAFTFGVAESDAVAELAAAAGSARLCPSPGRGLLAVGLRPEEEAGFVATAARLGFVTALGDPRLAIVACAGAPACGSGRLPTRRIAARIAAKRVDLAAAGVLLHLSGCPKRCAQPSGRAVTLVAEETGVRVTGDGRAVPAELERYLLEAAAW